MVLRDWYIQHEAKKRRQEAVDAELAPYRDYLEAAFERAMEKQREILARSRGRRRRPQISLAAALVKLPIKAIGELEGRYWKGQREKQDADRFKREFLNWVRTTEPHLDSRDPQEHVRRFSESYKTPLVKAYEEAYQQGRAQGLADARRERAAARGQPDRRRGETEN